MKASELRIGNWFEEDATDGGYAQITASAIQELVDDPLDDFYKPIPLTEEWLENFGFEKTKHGYYFERIEIRGIDYREKQVRFGSKTKTMFLTYVAYVHELQNLYFALTGEELKIEL